jgi:hypothetical protein
MPKTHSQPKPRPPKGSHTKNQTRAKGKGSTGGKMTSRLKTYKVKGMKGGGKGTLY